MSTNPGSSIRFVIAVSRGILRDQRVRRSVLFGLALADMLVVFAGSVLLDGWLVAHVGWFLVYWGVCLWLTLSLLLLALFDLLSVRRDAIRERRRLREETLSDAPAEDRREKHD